MLKNSKIKGSLERIDQYEDLQSNQRFKEETDSKRENQKLEFILNKYNFILNEYQLKYGNELFNELDRQLNMEAFDSVHNNTSEFRKILVENVSLIKEYEKNILEKSKSVQFLNSELNRIQMETEKLVEENKELREELEVTKEDLNRFYKSVLQDAPAEVEKKSMSGGFMFSRSSNNFNNEIQVNLDLIKTQNEHLLQLVEQSKYEAEHHKSLYAEYKDKYENLLSSNETLNSEFQRIIQENETLLQTKNYVTKKMMENNNKMLISDKKTKEAISSMGIFEIQNKYLKKELEHYKEMYDDLEKRKNSELNVTMCELNDLRKFQVEITLKFSVLEEFSSDLKFDNNKLKAELQIMKFDCDHMTKVLEESNFAVKSAAEKEKHIDMVIKSYKKKVDEALMEKEKGCVKQRLLEKQILKVGEDYSKLLQEKQSQYENFIDSSKEKFNQIIQNKHEEVSNLKNVNLSYKMEKDKYQNEYSTIKKEYDKFSLIFREENEKYIKKYEDSEKSANRLNNHLHDKLNNLNKKCEKIEFEKNNLENELSMLKSTEKSRDLVFQNLCKNDEVINKDFHKLKVKCEIVQKEKEYNEKEIERITNLYETKLEQLKEQNQLRITVSDNTLKSRNDDFIATEDKAFQMLKKQENITNKYKDELKNTVGYYENILDNLFKENDVLKKQIAFDQNEHESYHDQTDELI